MTGLSNKVKIYISLVSVFAFLLIVFMLNGYEISPLETFAFWTVLSIITESLTILMPSGVAVSVGFAISLAVIIVGGPLTAALVTGLGVMFRITKYSSEKKFNHIFNTPIYKTLYNLSQSLITAGCSGIVYIFVAGKTSYGITTLSVPPIVITLVVYMVLNTTLVSLLFSLLKKEAFSRIWLQNIKDTILSSIAVGMLGIIISLAYLSYGPWAVLLFFGPLLLARYSFKLYIDTKHMYMETIEAFNKAIEAKDPYTSGHASRVQKYAEKLARAINLPDNKVDKIKTAALLHDIGKIGIEDSILKKPGKLNEEEYEIIKQHPVIGTQILKDVYYLKDVINIIKYHHERYDGSGYPEGISGCDIPIEAAILAIADVFDAMTSDRPYRKALTRKQALSEIESNAGTQFHPKLAKAFVDVMRKEDEGELLENAS